MGKQRGSGAKKQGDAGSETKGTAKHGSQGHVGVPAKGAGQADEYFDEEMTGSEKNESNGTAENSKGNVGGASAPGKRGAPAKEEKGEPCHKKLKPVKATEKTPGGEDATGSEVRRRDRREERRRQHGGTIEQGRKGREKRREQKGRENHDATCARAPRG